jgi:hypothetical protein
VAWLPAGQLALAPSSVSGKIDTHLRCPFNSGDGQYGLKDDRLPAVYRLMESCWGKYHKKPVSPITAVALETRDNDASGWQAGRQ